MVLRSKSIVASALLTAAGAFSQETPTLVSEVPVVTVCEALSDLQRYDGKAIVVVGRFSYTDEGSWLDAECGFKVINANREFRTSISVSYVANDFAPPPPKPPGFHWDERLLREKLDEIKRTTTLREVRSINYSDEWMAFYGRLETQLPRKVRVSAQKTESTSGFGHLSSAPAQLITAKDGVFGLK